MWIVSKDREDAANHLEFRWIRGAAIRRRSHRNGEPYRWWGCAPLDRVQQVGVV